VCSVTGVYAGVLIGLGARVVALVAVMTTPAEWCLLATRRETGRWRTWLSAAAKAPIIVVATVFSGAPSPVAATRLPCCGLAGVLSSCDATAPTDPAIAIITPVLINAHRSGR